MFLIKPLDSSKELAMKVCDAIIVYIMISPNIKSSRFHNCAFNVLNKSSIAAKLWHSCRMA